MSTIPEDHLPPERFRSVLRSSRLVVVLLGIGLSVGIDPLAADSCSVPGTHPTIQIAADAPSCTEITLADQVFREEVLLERSLDLVGPATIEGSITASGEIVVVLGDLQIDAVCSRPGLESVAGAEIAGEAVAVRVVTGASCPSEIFSDGFEPGGTGAWGDP